MSSGVRVDVGELHGEPAAPVEVEGRRTRWRARRVGRRSMVYSLATPRATPRAEENHTDAWLLAEPHRVSPSSTSTGAAGSPWSASSRRRTGTVDIVTGLRMTFRKLYTPTASTTTSGRPPPCAPPPRAADLRPPGRGTSRAPTAAHTSRRTMASHGIKDRVRSFGMGLHPGSPSTGTRPRRLDRRRGRWNVRLGGADQGRGRRLPFGTAQSGMSGITLAALQLEGKPRHPGGELTAHGVRGAPGRRLRSWPRAPTMSPWPWAPKR